MKYPFTDAVRARGYTMIELASIWGLQPRQLSLIAKNPKPIHWLAIKGLEDRKQPKKPLAIILYDFDASNPEVQNVLKVISQRT